MDFRDVKGNKIETPDNYNWRPAVYGVLIEGDKILIIKPNWDDKFCLPGGSVELGENLTVSLEREFLEECKKIASKTIPSIYSLTNDLMKAHSIQHSVDLSTLCPNLLRLLEGKLSPDEFNRIRGFYQP